MIYMYQITNCGDQSKSLARIPVTVAVTKLMMIVQFQKESTSTQWKVIGNSQGGGGEVLQVKSLEAK